MNRIMRMGQVDRIVRDHLYDETKPGGPREKVGITVNEMLHDVNAIRGSQTDAGAIRRSLRNIENAGMLTKRNVYASRSFTYMWKPDAIMPSDYMRRPLPSSAKAAPVTTASAPISSGQQTRETIDDLLEERMASITGEKKIKATAKASVPRPAKIPAVIRPSGEEYLPRILAGMADIHAMQKLREGNLYTLLAGPPGGGKTALMEAAFADGPGGLFSLHGDEETRVDDFVGQLYSTGKGDETYWSDGPLTLAMKAGGVLFVDDATLINPKAIACMYPAMDGRGIIQIKTHIVEANGIMQPEIVKAQEGFFVVAAHNPGVPGAILSPALSSRFTAQIWLESDLELAKTLGVNANFAKLAYNLRTRKENGEMGVYVPEMRDLLAARDLGRIFGDYTAAENLLGKAPEDFQDDLAAEIRTVFGFDVTPKRMEVKGQL